MANADTEALTLPWLPSNFPSMSLADLLTHHEGKGLEFKRDDSSPEGIVRTVVAFANGAGGTLVVGVEDRTRRVRGVSEPTGLEERLASLISDRIEPRLLPDLLEIDNPGGLPPGLTLEDVRQGVSKLRNRVIGRVFHELGFIEQWGSGIQRMAQACRQAGLPEPLLEEVGSGFRVTLRGQGRGRPDLDALDQSVVDFVRTSPGGAPTSRIAAHISRTPQATRGRLKRLVDLGLLAPIGTGPRDPRRVFRAIGPGRSAG